MDTFIKLEIHHLKSVMNTMFLQYANFSMYLEKYPCIFVQQYEYTWQKHLFYIFIYYTLSILSYYFVSLWFSPIRIV
mgnify:CR=1 FL=1